MQRITANLAPADLRKAGPGFDLAIAAALLAASGQLPPERLQDVALAGELALDGSVRPVPGTLAMAEAAPRAEAPRRSRSPAPTRPEAALAGEPRVRPAATGSSSCALLGTRGRAGDSPGARVERQRRPARGARPRRSARPADLRYALEVAAAGGHSLLIIGPPGAGKSLAARRLPSILPPLAPPRRSRWRGSPAPAAGRRAGTLGRRPFRAPHHTISTAGLVGGGNPPRPGEVTLAHRGRPVPRRARRSSPARRSRRCASRSRRAG